MFLVPSFVALLQPFAPCFCAPSFVNWIVVLTGWVFARRRTITGALVAAKLPDLKHHSAYHRLFASARWSLDAVGLMLFEGLLPWCQNEKPRHRSRVRGHDLGNVVPGRTPQGLKPEHLPSRHRTDGADQRSGDGVPSRHEQWRIIGAMRRVQGRRQARRQKSGDRACDRRPR